MPSTSKPDWAVTDDKVRKAVKKIIEVGRPRKIILFGSYITGATTPNSDLDVMVVTRDDVVNTRAESIRIRRSLRGLSMPMDIIVVQEKQWLELKDIPGMIYRQAQVEGRTVYDA
jgi:predicted nucleotidyltransferase